MKGERLACSFCGATDKKLTKEHIYGNWMEGHFPDHPDVEGIVYTRMHANGHLERGRKPRPIPFHDARVRCACTDCNSDTLNTNLETPAQRLLPPMMFGEKRRYVSGEARQLAAWATKTSILTGAFGAYPDVEVFSFPQRNRLMLDVRPPVTTRVYAASVIPNTWKKPVVHGQSVFANRAEFAVNYPRKANGSYWFLHFAEMVFFTMKTELPVEPKFTFRNGTVLPTEHPSLSPFLVRLWPNPKPFDWPLQPLAWDECLYWHWHMWDPVLNQDPNGPTFVDPDGKGDFA